MTAVMASGPSLWLGIPRRTTEKIPHGALAAIANDIDRLLSDGKTVVLVDSGGETRSGQVCRHMDLVEDTRTVCVITARYTLLFGDGEENGHRPAESSCHGTPSPRLTRVGRALSRGGDNSFSFFFSRLFGHLTAFRSFPFCRKFLLSEAPETRAKRAGPFLLSTK